MTPERLTYCCPACAERWASRMRAWGCHVVRRGTVVTWWRS